MPPTNTKPNTLDACDPTLNATVSASAGSGKTWLLITRIVRLLIDGAEPGNIIALTFTRKAAGEMQIRLNQRLFEMATAETNELDKILKLIGCTTDDKIKKIAQNLYEKLMNSIYPVRIQTFHSFCQDILSRFPLEADIPPGFELIEDSSLLERQAWQALFAKAAKPSNAQLSDALDIIMQACNGPDNTRTALRSFLSHRSDWWAYTAHTQQAIDFASQQLAQQLQIDDSDASDPVDEFLNDITRGKLKVFANLLREINLKKGLQHADIIDQALGQNADDNDAVFSLLRSAFLTQKGEPLSSGRTYTKTMEKKLGADNAEHFVDLHQDIAAGILSVEEIRKRRFTYTLNKAWYFSGQQYVEIFQQLKREMRLLDFTDLEWKCYQLLQHADNAHWVQYKIDQRIDHLLIDEFQDTNPTQWNLLSPILEEIAANPEERSRSVFLVGDEKQSIYSFRRANPALQAQASDWLATNLNARATPLDFSRRSSHAIIHCVNQIFEQDEIKTIMTGYTTHDTYLNQIPGQVHLCELFQHDDDEKSQTESDDNKTINFRNPLKQPREITVKTLRHDEADNIARQILRLINTAELITDDATVRPVEFGDILILMRNRTHSNLYENTLKQYGIPFIGSKKGGLLDNLEIQDLSCLLNTLIAPYNNLALAQVLKSPIFSANDDDLVLLAEHGSGYWYERLITLASNTEDKNILSSALQRAAKLLPQWQMIAQKLPVHDCLDKIFSEGNIINRYMSANTIENKQKVASNCQRFLELSLETDSGRFPSITRFLQQLNHLGNYSESPPEEPLPISEQSRVRIMTIHGSKGLEAPVVFLVDCNSTSNNKNAYTSIVRWPAKNAQPNSFQLQLNKDKTDGITQKIQQEKLSDQAREELNLLYVALTRAREHLYISGVDSRKKQTNSWYQIIDNGLKDITELETDENDVNYKIYRHLAYSSNSFEQAEDTIKITKRHFTVDQRLLKPVKKLPASSYLISPSSSSEDSHGLSQTNTESSDTDISSPYTEDLAKWRGTIIHRTIELLCDKEQYPVTQQGIEVIHQTLKTETSLHHPTYIQQLNSCIDEAVSVYNDAKFESIFQPITGSKTYNEMPIMYKQGNQAIYGIIDRVIKNDTTITIIDYKSHRTDSTNSLEDAAQQFSKQLSFYRDGILKIWPQCTVNTGILFTHHKELIWLI
jgi:ATP-dependent helicase/nuclease subunit A